jgi:NAD(P)-dependent dehydrogenase (short-subunit alcohol dehydrogenase family)
VTKEESAATAVDQIVKETGSLHGMIVNAGRTKHRPALDFTTELVEEAKAEASTEKSRKRPITRATTPEIGDKEEEGSEDIIYENESD